MLYVLYIISGLLLAVTIVLAIIFSAKPNTNKQQSSADQVDFSKLNWTCGGLNGKNAKLSNVKISGLNVSTKTGMTMNWDVGMSIWGYPNAAPLAIACLFCKIDNRWVGGKFEWISTSRTTREFGNIKSGYAGWSPTYLNTTEFAFVVLSGDAKSRSNVIYFKR